MRVLSIVAAAGLVAGVAAGQAPVRSTAEQRETVSITVYNQDFGLVREIRTLDLGSGRTTVEYGDVTGQIEPYTVSVRPVGGGPLRVLEQNYRYDLLSPEQLVQKYVGRTITIYRWNSVTGRDEPYSAEVLSTNGGVVLRIGDEITFGFPGRMAFPEIPENLIAQPTLMWTLDGEPGRREVEVSYLTKGMSWRADYVLVVNDDDTEGDLTGWVTLDNTSGASFENAQLKLVAGDVQRMQDRMREYQMRARRGVALAESADQFVEEGLLEYHLYTLQRPTTVLNNEQKQVVLLNGEDVGIRQRLVLPGQWQWYRMQTGEIPSGRKVGVFLEFENEEANGLGMPLPRGVIRVYKADRSGAQQFVGEDRIDHTPRDETVRIKVGEAFDVVADRRQMEWNALGRCTSESRWEIELRNHKDEAVEVDVMEPVAGDWEIRESSHGWERIDSRTFRFRVQVPAQGETLVSYTVRVRWC